MRLTLAHGAAAQIAILTSTLRRAAAQGELQPLDAGGNGSNALLALAGRQLAKQNPSRRQRVNPALQAILQLLAAR